jgi:tRNA A-37 threonylcarbamoyl transferase component Bud32
MDRIGRYRIVKEIGRGAMGIVYLATDPTIGRSVAIKTVRLRDVDDAQQRDKLRERLFREARSAGVLSHPNIVTIYDMAEEDGIAYIAMEYVDGPTLDELISAAKPLESGKMFGILRQTATALDYAHTKGIVHRDIKPANIMLGRDGNVKVTDFGIAKINTAADSFTMTGTLVGTPNYMSPEQVQSREVTGRSDQFSLAVIAYEILTGERPFPGEQLSTVVYKIVAEEPVSPQKLNRTLGPYIDGVLRKALSKKPANRYRTCAEFVGSLETTCAATKGWMPVSRGASLNMSTAGGVAAIAAIPDPPAKKGALRKGGEGEEDAASSAGRGEARRESRILPLAAAFLMVAGVFSLLTWQGGDRSSAGQTPPRQEEQTPPALPKTDTPTPTSGPVTNPGTNSAPDAETPPTKPAETKPAETKPVETQSPETKPAEAPPAETRPPAKTEPIPPPKVDAAKPAKPSPMSPVVRNEVKLPVPIVARSPVTVVPRPAGRPQDLSMATNPSGANVTLDGNGPSCATPCTLQVPPGLHSLSIRLDGYQEERREIHVGSDAQEVPLISLRRAAGTLMITTVPAGATITINDKVQSQPTPAKIDLPPGTYTVMVEKNGRRQVDRVEIRNGNTNFVKIPLE